MNYNTRIYFYKLKHIQNWGQTRLLLSIEIGGKKKACQWLKKSSSSLLRDKI